MRPAFMQTKRKGLDLEGGCGLVRFVSSSVVVFVSFVYRLALWIKSFVELCLSCRKRHQDCTNILKLHEQFP